MNLYPGQPLGAISGSFEVPPRPNRRYKDKLCLRHRHAPPLYTIILQADPRNGHSISTDEREERRTTVRSLSSSLMPYAHRSAASETIFPSLSFPLSPSLRFSHRTVFSSLPLRLVPEGNKDGSAYVQPATGGGARLPSVGRTNANDFHARWRRHTPWWCGAREVLLYLACDVQEAKERGTPNRAARRGSSLVGRLVSVSIAGPACVWIMFASRDDQMSLPLTFQDMNFNE